MNTGVLSLRGRIGQRVSGDHDPSARQTVEPSLVRTAATPPPGGAADSARSSITYLALAPRHLINYRAGDVIK